MKNKLYLRIMSFALITSLVFGNVQTTAFASQNVYNTEEKQLSDVIHFESRQWKYSKRKGVG